MTKTPPFGSGTPRKLGISQSPTSGSMGKKLVIKNARAPSNKSNDFALQALAVFTRSIRAILSVPPLPVPESLQALYDLCQGSVSSNQHNMAQSLYDTIRLELERKVVSIKQSLARAIHSDAHEFLALLDGEWKAFANQLGMVRSIFLPLDRTYVLPQKSLLSIWDLGLDLFLNHVVHQDGISAKITSSLLTCIERERSATFFKAESDRLINIEAISEADYLVYVERRLGSEAERADLALSVSSGSSSLKGQILRSVETELITNHVNDILLGLPDFLQAAESDLGDLTRLFTLLSRVQALTQLKVKLQAYVEKTGSDLIADPARDDTMIEALLAFKLKLDKVLEGPFCGNQEMGQAVRSGFEAFINKRKDKPAEMQAKYIDAKMRLGNKAMTDTELERLFEQVLFLFRLTHAKDLFEAFYTKLFAKRLLLNKSASSDMEKIMLIKLQRECGSAFTAKLETMARDIELSSDLMLSYKEHRSQLDANDPFDLSVNVLTTGNWPSFPGSNVILPSDMVASLERFKRFYGLKYTGRNLAWQHSLDQCVLKAVFPKGRKELSVSLFQALCLMLFNGIPDGTKLAFKDIVTLTGLDKKEAARTMLSLASGRVRVLTKHPKGKEVHDDDEFSVNLDFKDDHVKIKINQIQMKETVEESKSTTDRVFVDRQNHVQLVIVRTLKSRKTIKHQELVMEVITQLKGRFKVETSEIKKAISSLIDRDYMERGDTKDT